MIKSEDDIITDIEDMNAYAKERKIQHTSYDTYDISSKILGNVMETFRNDGYIVKIETDNGFPYSYDFLSISWN